MRWAGIKTSQRVLNETEKKTKGSLQCKRHEKGGFWKVFQERQQTTQFKPLGLRKVGPLILIEVQ